MNECTKFDIEVVANFEARNIRESLEFWLQKLYMGGEIQFAPFDQIFQHLLGSHLCASWAPSCSVILIQTERWMTDAVGQCLNDILEDLAEAVRTAALRSRNRLFLVFFCPPSLKFRGDGRIHAAQCKLRNNLTSIPDVDVITTEELQTLYPAEDYRAYFDPYAEQLWQIPYTRLCFASLGTMVARRLYARRSTKRKLIVLDCDNTLWSGICAEEGPMNVSVRAERQEFQRFLIDQAKHGRLLCLCSKNEEKDVWQVFDHHPDMLLNKEHLTAWRINWESKAANLRSLSLELGLNLDSFIFIDDSALECAAVEALIPEILTLHLPADEAGIMRFLKHVWDLDQEATTADDEKRTFYYRQNAERTRVRESMSSIEEFLACLDLKVEINPLLLADLQRASQLTERTNQFNLNGIRRSEIELRHLLCDQEARILTVQARDRFGDYGTIGLIVYRVAELALHVDTFLLSCRALGRRIEHHMMDALVEVARTDHATRITFMYQNTAKNAPLRIFFNELGIQQRQDIWTIALDRLTDALMPALHRDQ